MTDPRYPIGKYQRRDTLSASERSSLIDQLAAAPSAMRTAAQGLSPEQLDTPYREGGWSVRQVIHHVPESHLNAYVRLKLTLTEEEPAIRPYDQDKWSRTPDVPVVPVETSLRLLESVQERFVTLLRLLEPREFQRRFIHPEHGAVNLDWLVSMYAWHGRHHISQITTLRDRMGW